MKGTFRRPICSARSALRKKLAERPPLDSDSQDFIFIESLTQWALMIQAHGVTFDLDRLIRASEQGLEAWRRGQSKADALDRAKDLYLTPRPLLQTIVRQSFPTVADVDLRS